jgi:hypothetical protein
MVEYSGNDSASHLHYTHAVRPTGTYYSRSQSLYSSSEHATVNMCVLCFRLLICAFLVTEKSKVHGAVPFQRFEALVDFVVTTITTSLQQSQWLHVTYVHVFRRSYSTLRNGLEASPPNPNPNPYPYWLSVAIHMGSAGWIWHGRATPPPPRGTSRASSPRPCAHVPANAPHPSNSKRWLRAGNRRGCRTSPPSYGFFRSSGASHRREFF